MQEDRFKGEAPVAQADPPVNKPKYSVSVTRSILGSASDRIVPSGMSSRLDRLLVLLDTGSSVSVRNTAAKQLAQLAVKSVTNDIVLVEDDVKSNRQQASQVDRSAWNELMSVVARILPFLHSRSFDTRTTASVAISQICSLAPLWTPSNHPNGIDENKFAASLPVPDFPTFSVQDLISQGNLLLASSGKEFVKPTGILATSAEVKKARKEAMGRLGLDFLDDVADDMELEKELTADMDIDPTEVSNVDSATRGNSPMDLCPEVGGSKAGSSPPTRSLTPVAPSPTTPLAPDIDLSALSARERNRLKRKRKQGTGAFVTAPPPQTPGAKFSATSSGTSNKARLIASDEKSSSGTRMNSPAPNGMNDSERVVIDPTKGGAVSPKESKQSKALEVEPGQWIWDGVVKVLEVDLFSAAWEVRHGAAIALRELLKVQGKYGGMRDDTSAGENELAHEKWCNDLAAQFLCVFVLDRFGDFVSDQVVAPVRETVSQTMASLMLHMPRRSLLHVHRILLQMIRQEFLIGSNGKSTSGKPSTRSTDDSERNHVWEVRHAGLLGIKYEVAVRSDIFDNAEGIKTEGGGVMPNQEGMQILRDVVDAAILGLGDRDDDVRSVAATCLLPVAQHLVDNLPESLEHILVVLWHCLSDMKDDLSSSVGAVMDLLGKLVAFEKVINILASETVSLPLSTLAPTLFPFFRHTIPNVRLAVVKTLASFMAVPNLPRDWVSVPFLCLLYQNLVCEERPDIRDASLSAWREAFALLSLNPDFLPSQISQQLTLDWYAVAMTPIGVVIDTSSFYFPSTTSNTDNTLERHNVDKNMIAQDLSLVPIETIFKARVAAATALAYQMVYWPKDVASEFFRPILIHYVESSSMLQKFLGAIISEEWARGYEETFKPSIPLVNSSTLAKEISQKTLTWLQGNPPPAYHEMAYALGRIHTECTALLQLFNTECKLPMSSIPFLGSEIDITGTLPNRFTVETAQQAVNTHYTRLRDSLGRTKKKEQAVIGEKRSNVVASIERYLEVKAQYDIRVSATFAAAFVALSDMPDKVSPVVKGIMNGIKSEENVDLQQRSAVAVASFIDFCSQHSIKQPPDKIIKNLCTFLCQDTEKTPTFAFNRKHTDGILSFQSSSLRNQKDKEGGKAFAKTVDVPVPEENKKARLSRRGAGFAFNELFSKFGSRLLDVIPNMWHSMAGGLLSAFQDGSVEKSDSLIEKQYGQDVIDSLSVLQAVTPAFDPGLWPRLTEVLPILDLALRSRFAIIRQAAARCFATVCDVMTSESMRYVVERIIPLLGDPLVLANRQGATELIYHIIQKLDIKALPYAIFLVVPILGRMSDSDDDVRSTSTNTFASLVKMVPLEAGLPDPPGFPEDLLKKRDSEREFLSQLLDGSKVAKYDIPVPIKAELRKYQQEGVNWLAFLAKYQLHGILCDDMGLGKTLQSICILASKHHERIQRYRQTKLPDTVHLPSLIICPPTLTGHWYYEILKYADNLKPALYTGNSRERMKLIPKLHQYDVVITSYEVVRNDIANLEHLNWLYCILDEGHVIKNAKTKLTKAVKCIRAQHRLILSGTPIQNNVLELWSLFDFLMPGFLGTETSFNERFGKPILANRDGKAKNEEAAALALEALHKQVLPFLLRRLKEDVLSDLPPKIIQDYYCELSELQKCLYDDFSNSKARASAEDMLRTKPTSSKEDAGQQHIFQSLQYLRKLCNHPALVLKTDQAAINAAFEKARLPPTSLSDIQQAPKLLALKQLLVDCGIGTASHLHADSTKNDAVDSVTDSSGFAQHRVLIFCQMKQMLDIIETDLFRAHMPSVTYMRLDGGTEANKRHAIVQTFNSDPSIDCLLLTTHVGGLGLTLTGADTVIFVEHDWNPMKDLQAMDRAHRIGQKKVVNVYRLITKGTLEEKIMGLQRFKLNIANSVVTQQNSGLSSMDTDLVLDLFRRTTEREDVAAAAKKAKEISKPITQKNVLQGLEDLPTEEEYEGLDISSFMGSLDK